MRTLIHAAFLAGMLVPGAAYAADLDHPYEPGPPPVAIAPPPPVAVVPPCGVYRPCFRPYRLGFWRRPWRFGYYAPRPYVVGPRPYAVPPRPEGYGYDYDRERFEGAHEHVSRYGYAHPGPEAYEPRGGYGRRDFGPRGEPGDGYGPRGRYEPRDGYGPREGYSRERYGERRPYADPLGHDGYERHGGRGERFDRGPGPDERG